MKAINILCLHRKKYVYSLDEAETKKKTIDTMSVINGVVYEMRRKRERKEKYDNVRVSFSHSPDIDEMYRKGNFVIAYFPPDRRAEISPAKGVEDVTLDTYSPLDAEPGQLLQKYMLHLKTQQSYARNEGDLKNADRIQKWFDRFVDALRILLDDDSVTLSFEYKEYAFKIHQQGRVPFGFDELSDGYSAVIYILSDLILRMDQNYLHIEMQKKILPFLTTFFPRIQFIVTTHSPYILNSISNAKAYDLEQCIE